jgi:hypothetical protein
MHTHTNVNTHAHTHIGQYTDKHTDLHAHRSAGQEQLDIEAMLGILTNIRTQLEALHGGDSFAEIIMLLPTALEDEGGEEGDADGDEDEGEHYWRATAFHWSGKLEDLSWIGAWVGTRGPEVPTPKEFEASANTFDLHTTAEDRNGQWVGQYQMGGDKYTDLEHELLFDASSPRVVAKGPSILHFARNQLHHTTKTFRPYFRKHGVWTLRLGGLC